MRGGRILPLEPCVVGCSEAGWPEWAGDALQPDGELLGACSQAGLLLPVLAPEPVEAPPPSAPGLSPWLLLCKAVLTLEAA